MRFYDCGHVTAIIFETTRDERWYLNLAPNTSSLVALFTPVQVRLLEVVLPIKTLSELTCCTRSSNEPGWSAARYATGFLYSNDSGKGETKRLGQPPIIPVLESASRYDGHCDSNVSHDDGDAAPTSQRRDSGWSACCAVVSRAGALHATCSADGRPSSLALYRPR